MEFFTKIGSAIFKFLASLKLAVFVLLGFAYVLALGTIYESLYGTPVAKEKVYNTIWFSLLLLLLGINVFCAALSRFPWKKHHIGFVVTHAGIITILIGSFITQKYGIDGSMALSEGESSDRVVLDEPLVQVAEPDAASVQTWRVRFLANPPNPQKPWVQKLKGGGEVEVDQYYQHAMPVLQVKKEGSKINPALKIVFSGMPGQSGEINQWIFEKEAPNAPHKVQMGPAQISFLSKEDLEKISTKTYGAQGAEPQVLGSLELRFEDGKTLSVSVPAKLGKVSVPDTPYILDFLRYLPDAHVVKNELISETNNPNNPAIEFDIYNDKVKEKHIVFANFPDLEGIHGTGQKLKIKTRFQIQSNLSTPKAELVLARADQKEEPEFIYYRIFRQGKWQEIEKAKIGEELATGWMTIRFKIDEYILKAEPELYYRKIIQKGNKESSAPSAIHLKIKKDGKELSTWLEQGDFAQLLLEGNPYLLRYGLRALPLNFNLHLNTFKVLRYPGSNSPSSFESEVKVAPKSGQTFDVKIYMNHPLQYEGYTFYQSSYQESPGGPAVSIFSVARDPGTPVKYLGSILLVLGIVLMFWFKPLFIQKRSQKNE